MITALITVSSVLTYVVVGAYIARHLYTKWYDGQYWTGPTRYSEDDQLLLVMLSVFWPLSCPLYFGGRWFKKWMAKPRIKREAEKRARAELKDFWYDRAFRRQVPKLSDEEVALAKQMYTMLKDEQWATTS